MTIKVVETGTLFKGLPVTDGFGYINKDFAANVYNGRKKIQLGRTKGTYTMWQRVNMDEAAWKEMEPHFRNRLENVADLKSILYDHHAAFDERIRLYELDEAMLTHPYVALSIARSQAEYFARVATTMPIKQLTRVAVPTLVKKVAAARLIEIDRNPIDSPSSIQVAVPSDEEQDVLMPEIARIAELEVYQHSISSHDISIKGCLGKQEDLPYDIVLGMDDIKMTNLDIAPGDVIEIDAIIVFTQAFDKGSAMGVNEQWAKDTLGLDHDGDLVNWTDLIKLPELARCIRSNMQIATKKLTKVKHERTQDNVVQSIIKQMANIIGWATNATTDFHMVDLDQQHHIANFLGYKSLESCEIAQNFLVKCGTDIFKTDVDLRSVERQIAAFYKGLESIMFSLPEVNYPFVGAPYKSWPNNYFVNKMPMVIDRIVVDQHDKTRYLVDGDFEELSQTDLDNAIYPFMTGTIPEICRRTLPTLQHVFDEPIATTPLISFRDWAKYVSPEVLRSARAVHTWYNGRAVRLSWHDPRRINTFKTQFHEYLLEWMEEYDLDRETAAAALWRVAHSARDNKSHYGKQAASVFIGFPGECREIVENKPGVDLKHVLITGINYQVPGLENWSGEVSIQQFSFSKNGKTLVRTGLIAEIDGQEQLQNSQYPLNMIGLVAKNSFQPTDGNYKAVITKNSDATWIALLI
jgi:hypothetical protein